MSALYGIIGYPLGHSFSPAYFTKKFISRNINASYLPFPLHEVTEFPILLEDHPNLKGLNVTIPYKKSIIHYLDELDQVANDIDAVNCILIKNGVLKGYNTDVIGFRQSIIPLLKPQHKRALVLGTGGSADAVCYVLKELGIPFTKVSRYNKAGMLTFADVNQDIINAHKLIINTTPLGMYPDTTTYPLIPYEFITDQYLLFDLIYNPVETMFLKFGAEKGAAIKNGYEMLVLQAEESWRIWNKEWDNDNNNDFDK